MKIVKYDTQRDEDKLMELLFEEGDEWSCYTSDDSSDKFKKSLQESITYVAYESDTLCGFSRSIEDPGFYIYVCDLLVKRSYRGNEFGRRLMECIYNEFPDHVVFVMSDVDEYYKKQGYKIEGTIFEVTKP